MFLGDVKIVNLNKKGCCKNLSGNATALFNDYPVMLAVHQLVNVILTIQVRSYVSYFIIGIWMSQYLF